MYSLEPTGIYLSGPAPTPTGLAEETKLIPYEEILDIRKINLAESIITGWNLLKPGLDEEYMGVEGDPLHVMMIETREGRYLLRGDDLDQFIAAAKARLQAYRKS